MQYKSRYFICDAKTFSNYLLQKHLHNQSNDRYLDNQCSIVFNVHPDYASKRTNVDNLSFALFIANTRLLKYEFDVIDRSFFTVCCSSVIFSIPWSIFVPQLITIIKLHHGCPIEKVFPPADHEIYLLSKESLVYVYTCRKRFHGVMTRLHGRRMQAKVTLNKRG